MDRVGVSDLKIMRVRDDPPCISASGGTSLNYDILLVVTGSHGTENLTSKEIVKDVSPQLVNPGLEQATEEGARAR